VQQIKQIVKKDTEKKYVRKLRDFKYFIILKQITSTGENGELVWN